MKQEMLSSKAQTLRLLSESRTSAFVIDPFISFTVGEWRASPPRILRLVLESGLGELVVVRSSARIEDVDPDLPPGLFHSELGVEPSNEVLLATAIERVVQSFARHERARSAGDANEIVVQRQLVGAAISGVLTTGPAPDLYFAVDYNEESDRTDGVTAGRACKRVDILREAHSLAEPWQRLRQTVLAVEALIKGPLLIEFGVSSAGQVHVFQARANRLGTGPPSASGDRRLALSLLEEARSELAARLDVWSDMADWNPGEMLGDRPRPLAVSLYQRLVTDEAWVRGRASLGYRYVTPSVLVETLAGKPYVNVRRSFLSLTPASLRDELAERLVEDRLRLLKERPELHDKVELDLLFTAADVIRPGRTACLLERGFSRIEVDGLDAQLRTLTSSAISAHASLRRTDVRLVGELVEWCVANRPGRDERDVEKLLHFVHEALPKCRDEGIVPFARQARLAFIARDLLNRLSIAGCIGQRWFDHWWRSLHTVAQRVASAFTDLCDGRMSRADFNAAFGHLRARTYDICSPRYDRIHRLPSPRTDRNVGATAPTLTLQQRDRMAGGLKEAGLGMSATDFLEFARSAIEVREDIKFAFSTLLSEILEAIAGVGEAVGFLREEMSFLTVGDIGDPAVLGSAHEQQRSRCSRC